MSGKKLRVPVWQEVLILLAGPVPGMLLGAYLYHRGAGLGEGWVHRFANLLLGLNAFNLIPVSPLDGGRILNAVLFRRNRWIESAFQAVAGSALILFALKAGGATLGLGFVGYMMLSGLRHQLRIGKVIDGLRQDGTVLDTTATSGISEGMARAILKRLRAALPEARHKAFLLAQDIRTVYERLHAGRPGWIQTGMLLGVYLASAVLPIWVHFAARAESVRQQEAEEAEWTARLEPIVPWSCNEDRESFPAKASPFPEPGMVTVAATWTNSVPRPGWFGSWPSNRPPGVELRRFASSVVLEGPKGPQTWLKPLLAEGRALGLEMMAVYTGVDGVGLEVSCSVPDPTGRKSLEHDLSDYFLVRESFEILPPWDPRWLTNDVERPGWRRARRDWARAHDEANAAAPEASGPEAIAALESKDPNALQRFFRAQSERHRNAARERLTQAIRRTDDPLSHEVVEAYLDHPFPPWERPRIGKVESAGLKEERAAWLRRHARLFGADSSADPTRETAMHGHLSKADDDGIRIQCEPGRIQDGFQALTRFLCDHGATGIRYRLVSLDSLDGLE